VAGVPLEPSEIHSRNGVAVGALNSRAWLRRMRERYDRSVDIAYAKQGLQDWCSEVLTGFADPLVPLPPDAKVEVRLVEPVVVGPHEINDVGVTEWEETYAFELRLTMREQEPRDFLLAIPWALRDAAKRDGTLHGRFDHASVPVDDADTLDHDRVRPSRTPDGWVIGVPVFVDERVAIAA